MCTHDLEVYTQHVQRPVAVLSTFVGVDKMLSGKTFH